MFCFKDMNQSMNEQNTDQQFTDRPQKLKETNIIAILAITFQQFAVFPWKFDLPQVRRNLISSIINLVHEMALELPSNLKLKILGNKEIIAKY